MSNTLNRALGSNVIVVTPQEIEEWANDGGYSRVLNLTEWVYYDHQGFKFNTITKSELHQLYIKRFQTT